MSKNSNSELKAYLEKKSVRYASWALKILELAKITTMHDWRACMQKHNTWEAMNDFLKQTVFANTMAWREDTNVHTELYYTVRMLTDISVEFQH